MAVTMKQIAEIAGVSRGTVDRVLNNRPGVNAQVAEDIQKISDKLGYKTNVAGRLLSKKNLRKRIGIIANSENNPFYFEVFQGIQAAVNEVSSFGFSVVTRTAEGFDAENQLRQINELVDSGVDALVVTPINSPEIISRFNELAASNIPVVAMNSGINAKCLAYVGANYEMSGETAGGLMGMMTAGKPCRVGVITGSDEVEALLHRVIGFRNVIERDFPNVSISGIRDNNDRIDLAYQYVKDYFKQDKDVNAIYIVSAGQAGVIHAIEELGLAGKVPVLMYDLTPAVLQGLKDGIVSASITQDPFQQGYRPIKVLYEYFVHGTIPESDKMYTHVDIKLKYNI